MDIESEETGRKNLMKESCICVCVCVREEERDHTIIMKRERGGGENKKSHVLVR